MIERGDGSTFLFKTLTAGGIADGIGQQGLERDLTAEASVASAIDGDIPPAPSGDTIS